MDPAFIAECQRQLEEEKRRLEAELANFATKDPKMRGDWDARFPAPPSAGAASSHSSQDEQADAFEEYEAERAQEQSLESRLVEVAGALGRIGDGTYGVCLACQRPILAERLSANPAAAYDIEHQPKS